MFKALRVLDSMWFVVVPLFACGYLVFNENPHSLGIIWTGWLLFMLHMLATMAIIQSDKSRLSLVWSILNSIALLFCLYFEIIDLEGFLILELVCEVASYSCAALFFVITNQKINGVRFWKKLGPGIAILNLIILGGIVAPFILVWIDFLTDNSNSTFYWIAGAVALLIAIVKKTSVLKDVVAKVNAPKTIAEDQTEKEPESKKENSNLNKYSNAIIIGFLLGWFVIMMILKNIG